MTTRAVIVGALGLYRAEPARVAVTAVLIFLPVDVLSIVLHEAAAHVLEVGYIALALGAQGISFFLVTAGQVFLAGVLDDLVGAKLENTPALSLTEAFRHLPLGRLILVDVLVSAIAGVTALLLVIPGIIAFALFGIVGSVINIEDRKVLDSLRRSAQLVRPHLWVACVVIVIPLGIELGVENWFLSFAHGIPWAEVLLVSALLSVTTRAMISLLEVILGHALIHGSHAVASIT